MKMSPTGTAELSPGRSPGYKSDGEESRRDDWKLPVPRLRSPDPIALSVVPTGLFKSAC